MSKDLTVNPHTDFFFFKRNSRSFLFIYLFIHDCVESSFLCEGSPQLRQAGTTLHRGARASHHRGLPCCGAQAPDAQAQQLWLTGPVAPRHAGSSQTRARTRVPCTGRQILNHCATREAPPYRFLMSSSVLHFYCWVTNYHKFSSLKNTHLLVHSSVVQETRHRVAGFSPQGLLRLKSKGFDRATFLSGSSGEESTSRHNHIVGRI